MGAGCDRDVDGCCRGYNRPVSFYTAVALWDVLLDKDKRPIPQSFARFWRGQSKVSAVAAPVLILLVVVIAGDAATRFVALENQEKVEGLRDRAFALELKRQRLQGEADYRAAILYGRNGNGGLIRENRKLRIENTTPPAFTKPYQLKEVRDHVFGSGEIVLLDGLKCLGCTFNKATLKYNGTAPFYLQGRVIPPISILSDRPQILAAMVLAKEMEAGSYGSVIKRQARIIRSVESQSKNGRIQFDHYTIDCGATGGTAVRTTETANLRMSNGSITNCGMNLEVEPSGPKKAGPDAPLAH